jgi:hypothetical protein
MMSLIAAAVLAAQPAPPANASAQQQMPMQHEQHEGMKKDGCECCKDMEAKMKEGHHPEHGAHAG